MEVLKVCAISAVVFFLISCSSETPESITPLSKDECVGPSTLVNKYVVKFKNGEIKVIKNNSREDFVKNYVTAHFEKIERIEFDEKINIFPLNEVSPIEDTIDGTWGVEAVNADAAWARGYFGEGVVVAVVDTGIDREHVWLKDRVYKNNGEIGLDESFNDKRYNGIDDDNNGFIDDYSGFNFVDNNSDVKDFHGHGTHVSGIIAIEHSDTTYQEGKLQGIAPKSVILPVKMLGEDGGEVSAAILAIKYAAKMGANIINASWGSSGACSTLLKEAISELKDQNIIFISAAGNEGKNIDIYPVYPANFELEGQITVGSVGVKLGMADHSNYGKKSVNVFAPGYKIASTLPNDKFGSLSGTSMATPFVSGFAALVKNKNPGISILDLKSEIIDHITYSPGAEAFEKSTYLNSSKGRIDILNYFKFN